MSTESSNDKSSHPGSARQFALIRLTRSDCSVADLIKYLRKKNLDPQDIQETVEWLKEQNLVNDDRYARLVTRALAHRNKGPSSIRMKLMQKGIKMDAKAVKGLYEELAPSSELEAARQFLARRYPDAASDRKMATKAFQALVRRGFSFDVAREAIKSK